MRNVRLKKVLTKFTINKVVKVVQSRGYVLGYVLGRTLFSSGRRTIGTLFVAFVLLSIPISIYLVNQRQEIRQQAVSSSLQRTLTTIPTCSWSKNPISPGSTSELTITYSQQTINTTLIPDIDPVVGYKIIGNTQSGGIIYQFDKSGETWVVSLKESFNGATINSCTISKTH